MKQHCSSELVRAALEVQYKNTKFVPIHQYKYLINSSLQLTLSPFVSLLSVGRVWCRFNVTVGYYCKISVIVIPLVTSHYSILN